MSCAPYQWQYCWKEISAVAYIFYLVHCLLRHEITLHVLWRDKYSTSMQQFCHPGNNSYKQEPYSFQAYMHTGGGGPHQIGTSLHRGGTPQSSSRIRVCGRLAASAWRSLAPPPSAPLPHRRGPSGRVTSSQSILKRRHRCHNTHARFGGPLAAVPVLHIAKEALQFRYSTDQLGSKNTHEHSQTYTPTL